MSLKLRYYNSFRDDPVVIDGKLYGQDFDELKASCLDSGELFTDPEFPADDDSIYFSKVSTFFLFLGNQ